MKNTKGITLIALIITIIVMLILVGVSIKVTLNSGLFESASKAVKGWNVAEKEENDKLSEVDKMADDIINNRMDPTSLYGALYTDGTLAFYSESEHVPETRNGATLVQKTEDISDTADLELEEVKKLLLWPWNEEFASKVTSVVIAEPVAPKSTRQLFRGLTNIKRIENLGNLYTCNVTSMREMFAGCYGLETIDLSGLNTENVVNMQHMFFDCCNLKQVNLRNLNTSKVENLLAMFYACANLERVDMSNWDTSSVTTMEWMFGSGDNGAIPNEMKIKEIKGLEDFDVSNVTNMTRMFRACKDLEKLDLHKWNVENVTSMLQMFNNCRSLKTLNIDGWNMKNVTNIEYMFNSCYSLEGTITLSFDSSKITTYLGTFNGTSQNSNNTLKVNYTSSAASIIDNVIATQTSNKIQKGIQVD